MPNSHRHLHRRAESVHNVDNEGPELHTKREAVVKTIYKTMAPTFEGDVAGYKTVKSVEKPADKTTQAPKNIVTTKAVKQEPVSTEAPKKLQPTTEEAKPKVTAKVESSKADKNKVVDVVETSTQAKPKTTASSKTTRLPSVIHVPTDTETLESVLAKATGEASPSKTAKRIQTEAFTTSPALASASASESVAPSTSDDKSGGSSAGAKAGIAFAVLGGLLMVGLLVFFIFNRRRKQAQREKLNDNDDEKLHGPMAGGVLAHSMSTRTNPNAPRISLRPVTQFLPNWNPDKRASKGAAMSLAPATAAAGGAVTSRAPGGNAWERPTTGDNAHPNNPFGTHAERSPTPIMEESIHNRSTPPSPVSEKTPFGDPMTANGPTIAAAGTGAASALARKTSMRNNGPTRLDLTLPALPTAPGLPSPAGTEFSISSASPENPDAPSAGAAAIAAAGGPANSAVHRVQLDFNPTMEDEIDLRAGDLVRLLHEYDDGWALCIRLDRSKQGVCPRTCLSTRPVKPRPAQGGPRQGPPIKPVGPPRGPGPNPNQGQRPMTPQGFPVQGRPGSPAGRPMPPNGARGQSPMGRPMSPGPRSQSPGPRNGPPGGRNMSSGPRPQSPGPRQGPPGGRSQSPSGSTRRNSPPGPSPMNPAQEPLQRSPSGTPSGGPPTGPVGRKPVPGQAY
ncbi:hypothetical protein G7046_g7250 [Stylonectria norvegica]|nr:hypothetical protein G7046_g7250 [Stylonectria norvegica]